MDDATATPEPELRITEVPGAGQAVKYGDSIVGTVDRGTIILNLGWARIAGLGVKIFADPQVEADGVHFRNRYGVLLDRPAGS